MGLPNHGPGLWWHPEARPLDHNDLDAWLSLVRTLERARFDMIFFGDSVGVPDVYRGSADQALIDAIGIPSGDRSVLISARACTRSTTAQRSFGLPARTCPSPRPSAHRCCFKPGRQAPGARSLLGMPKACS